MKENDDLRIYRNVYQKLLLRTRRNPMNDEYEKEFQDFKKLISDKFINAPTIKITIIFSVAYRFISINSICCFFHLYQK